MILLDSKIHQRIDALREYAILDTTPEQGFDDISRLTSFICQTPVALITLLDLNRQWFKSRVGFEPQETPLEQSFCAYTIQQEGVFQVPDATVDSRFSANPLVMESPNIRFYAGAPIVTPQGVPLGALCAIDSVPRELSEDQKQALLALARQVMAALELRRVVRKLDVARAEKLYAEAEVESLRELLPMCAWCRKVRDDEELWLGVEDYLTRHAASQISHGICPDCANSLKAQMRRAPVSAADARDSA